MNTSPDEMDKPSSSSVAAEPSTTSLSDPPAEYPSFPPTEVRRWLICPVFRDYSARWESLVEAWTPHRIVGTAIHAGAAEGLKDRQVGSYSPATDARAIQVSLDALRAGYVPQEQWGLDGLEALVTKGVTRLLKEVTEKLLPGAEILGVETIIVGGGGRRRILDLCLLRADLLEVWDWKSHIKMDDRYLPETQKAAVHSFQLLDYAYHGEAHFQKECRRVGQGHIILGPKLKMEFVPVNITLERLVQWRKDAEEIWYLNDAQDRGFMPRWHNWEACSAGDLHFGKVCPFFDACHTFFDNTALFPALYRPIPVKEK